MSAEPVAAGPLGRVADIDRVRAYAGEAVLRGAGSFALVEGAAGTGKTTALAEALDAVTGSGLVPLGAALHLRCPESAATERFWLGRAVVEQLGLAAPHAVDSSLLRPGVMWTVPALKVLTTGHIPDDKHDSDIDYTLLHGLFHLVSNVMAAGPLVLAVDDLQYCDEKSLRWLDYLLRRARHRPLTVLCSVRAPVPTAVLGVLAEHLGSEYGSVIALNPLDLAGVRVMVASTTGATPGPQFVTACHVLSGGHPGTLVRLLDAVTEAGLAPLDSSVGELHRIGRDVISCTVAASLAGQPEHVRKVARAVAVLTSTDVDLVSALSGVPVREVRSSTEFLRDNNLLPAGESLRHELVRGALLRGSSPSELNWMRDRAARLLNDAGLPAEVVASQLLPLCITPEPWMQTVLRDAARDASRRGAPKDALRHLSPLLDLRPGDIGLRGQVADLLAKTNPLQALEHLRAALDLAQDPRTRATLAIQFGVSALAVHQAPEAVDVLMDAGEALDAELGDRDTTSSADRELSTLLLATAAMAGFDGRSTVGRIRRLLNRIPEPAGNTPAERHLLAMLALDGAVASRPVDEVTSLALRALPLDEASYDSSAVAPTLVLTLTDRTAEALVILDRVVANCGNDGALWSLCQSLGVRARVRGAAGDLVGAIADAGRSLQLAAKEGWHPRSIGSSGVAMATALVARGEPERAQAVLDSVAGSRIEGSPWEWHNFQFVTAAVRTAQGDVDGALELLWRCGRGLDEDDIANPLFLPWWCEAALLLAGQDRVAQARPLVERGEQLAASWDVPRSRGLALIARAMISTGTARIERLVEAAEVLESSSALLDLQRAELLLGRELLGRSDSRGAREHLRISVDLATRCGARPAAVEARELLLAAGGRMRQVTGARTDVLTERERHVVALAGSGASNREIAEELFVTPRTIEVHLTNAYRKLGIAGRADLPGAAGSGRNRSQT